MILKPSPPPGNMFLDRSSTRKVSTDIRAQIPRIHNVLETPFDSDYTHPYFCSTWSFPTSTTNSINLQIQRSYIQSHPTTGASDSQQKRQNSNSKMPSNRAHYSEQVDCGIILEADSVNYLSRCRFRRMCWQSPKLVWRLDGFFWEVEGVYDERWGFLTLTI